MYSFSVLLFLSILTCQVFLVLPKSWCWLVLGSSFGLQSASAVQIVYVTGGQWIRLITEISSIVLVLQIWVIICPEFLDRPSSAEEEVGSFARLHYKILRCHEVTSVRLWNAGILVQLVSCNSVLIWVDFFCARWQKILLFDCSLYTEASLQLGSL